jgi:beta-N-acetylhexosaminidase
VIPVGKHFPGHGDTSQDSHLTLPRVERTRESLEQTELIPFKHAIQHGLEVIMTAHVVYPAWDAEQPATFSPCIMNDVLRKDLQFSGLIISDDLEMRAIDQSLESIPEMGTRAGVDLFLICHDLEKVTALQEAMIQDIEMGRIPQATIEQSLARIFQVKKHLQVPRPEKLDFVNILQQNQSLAEEMWAFFKE